MIEGQVQENQVQTDFTVLRGQRDLQALRDHVRERGVVGGTRAAIGRVPGRLKWMAFYAHHRRHDRAFDRDHGVSTCGVADQSELTATGDNQAHALEYEPTPVRAFHHMLSTYLPADVSEFTFVDFGSGKGRSLLLASHYPFAKIVGVDLAQELHEAAVANVAAYDHPDQRCLDIEPLHQDATTYDLPPTPIVFYLYYPFRRDVMERVLDNIERSYIASPRKMIFINRLDKPEWYDETVELFDARDWVSRRPDAAPKTLGITPPYRIANYETPT